ncbi:MAG TPA: hypothetical protein VG796_27545 [Verrucomicrobiales bacterium]|nr:hypothetical protein [Verrucomicrobiales bacterium]
MNGTKSAWSALSSLLIQRRMSVAELYKRLKAKGRHFDRKSVYRLASHEPLQTLSMPLVGAVCEELNVDLQHLISLAPPAPKLARIDNKTQERLDDLMTRNTEGKLSASERRELETLVDKVERLSLENARLLARQARHVRAGQKPKTPRRKQPA